MNPDIHIRLAQPIDTSAIAVLATQVWLHTYATTGITPDVAEYVIAELTPQKYQEILKDSASRVFVAEQGDNLIGFAVVKCGCPCPCGAGSAAELQTLYVQEHFLRAGVGKSLLRATEIWVREQSNTALWLTVNAQSARAIAFYQHLGYAKVGTTYFVLGEGRHENHLLVGPAAMSGTSPQANAP
nr:GNAT family N-acetyltransferase [Rhodoferax sp.]